MSTWNKELDYLVTIFCPVYNHEEFIIDCLNGLLSQVTIYPFKIIIRDDCSTDNTQDIIDLFADQYPNIITVYKEVENTYSQGQRLAEFYARTVTTPFMAVCEGDDFWIESNKLQLQLDALLNLQDASVVASYGGVKQIRRTKENTYEYMESYKVDKNIITDLEFQIVNYFHTSTLVCKSDILKEVVRLSKMYKLRGDTTLRILMCKFGHVHVQSDILSVYRYSGAGVWSSLSLKERHQKNYDIFNDLSQAFTGKYHQSLQKMANHFLKLLNNL